MKKKVINFIGIVTIFLLASYAGAMIYIHQHEFTHQQIYKSYGIDTKTEINPLKLKGSVTIQDMNQYNERCDEFCHLAQKQTDIVGYHTGILIVNVWVMVAFVFFSRKLLEVFS